MKQLFITFIVGLVFSFHALADRQRSIPIPPQELILAMPKAPVEHDGHWSLKQSWGCTDYASPWLFTLVTRNLTFVPNPPPDGSPPPKPAPVKTVTVQIKDTGFDPSANSLFLIKAAKPGGSGNQVFNGFPIKEVGSGNLQIVWMWVAQRFIVEVTMTNADDKDYEKWLTQVDTSKLIAAEVTPADKIQRPFKRILFDELDPSRNSVSEGTYVTPEESKEAMDAFKLIRPTDH